MRFWLTVTILNLLLALAYWRGGQPERVSAIALAVAFVIGATFDKIRGQINFLEFDLVYFAIEMSVLFILTYIALKANRFWPLTTCSLQFFIISAHAVKLFHVPGMSGVYWGMTTIPSYIQLIIIVIGIIFHSRRMERVGPYKDWL